MALKRSRSLVTEETTFEHRFEAVFGIDENNKLFILEHIAGVDGFKKLLSFYLYAQAAEDGKHCFRFDEIQELFRAYKINLQSVRMDLTEACSDKDNIFDENLFNRYTMNCYLVNLNVWLDREKSLDGASDLPRSIRNFTLVTIRKQILKAELYCRRYEYLFQISYEHQS